jgi:hypothetical protein
MASESGKTTAIIVWVLTIFFSFIPGLIFYLVKKDDAFVLGHAKEALNWSITAIIAYVVISIVASFIGFVAYLGTVVWLCTLAFCVLGAISASKEQSYETPFGLRLI